LRASQIIELILNGGFSGSHLTDYQRVTPKKDREHHVKVKG
jgi:hypothetical protein